MIVSVPNSVVVSVSEPEEHTTVIISSVPSSLTVDGLPPYLSSSTQNDYDVFYQAKEWSSRPADGKTYVLTEDTQIFNPTDGKVFVGVPEEVNVDSRLTETDKFDQVSVDSKYIVAQSASERSVDGKGVLARDVTGRAVDGRSGLAQSSIETETDSRFVLVKGMETLKVDSRKLDVHITDLQWVDEFLNQLFPELKSSSEIWVLPVWVDPKTRQIVNFPPFPEKRVVVFGSGIIVSEKVEYWRTVGISSGDYTIFTLTGTATAGRVVNTSDERRLVVFIAYKP